MSDLPYNEWCHVYAQYAQHSEAKIEGTREALESIRDAVDAALKSGRQGRTKTLFTSDGEGYRVTVDVRTLGYLEEQPLPYMACWAGGLGQSYHNTENELKERTRQMVERHNANEGAPIDALPDSARDIIESARWD